MSIIYYPFLAIYGSSMILTMLSLGGSWNRIKFKFKINPKIIVVVLYVLSFFILQLGFRLPFTYHLIFNLLMILCLYLGTHFQLIGLTGGIATGKSTVSQILSENGFDIIDLDKIAKQVTLIFVYQPLVNGYRSKVLPQSDQRVWPRNTWRRWEDQQS